MSRLEPGEYLAPRPGLAKIARCKACRARIVFVQGANGQIPLGVATARQLDEVRTAMRNHFELCPGRDRMSTRANRSSRRGAVLQLPKPRREREVQHRLF